MWEVYIALAFLSLALFISLSLHIIFCFRRRGALCTDGCCFGHISERETQSQTERQNFHNLSYREPQENPSNHHEQQENPIYGNINIDRSEAAEDCYERMTMQCCREHKKTQPLDGDLNYASLDLKVAMKRKKKHSHLQGQTQGHNTLQDHLPEHLTPPPNAFLEVDADEDAHLPSRETCTMVSHSSIYLNSQQMAQEAEEMERKWSANTEMENGSRDGNQWGEDGRSRQWKIDQDIADGTDSKDYGSNGNVCSLLSEDDT